MSTTSVEVQKQKAIEMREMVQEFAAKLTKNMNELSDDLDALVRGGFPEDVARNYYVGYYTPDNNIISDLNKKMLNDHVKFLDDVIANFDGILNLK
jgi:hypothetical protein